MVQGSLGHGDAQGIWRQVARDICWMDPESPGGPQAQRILGVRVQRNMQSFPQLCSPPHPRMLTAGLPCGNLWFRLHTLHYRAFDAHLQLINRGSSSPATPRDN